MKKLPFVVCAIATLVVCAAETNDVSKLTSAEKRARRRARMEARIAAEGGMLRKPNSGSYARVVNCQKRVTTEFIRSVVEQFNTGLNVHIDVTEMEPMSNPFALAEKALAIPRTGLATIIVDDENLPPILSAMENGWAILNVRHLRDDLPPKDVYELRLRKEINRAFAEAAGAGLSFNKPCVMEPVYRLSDLDSITFPVISPEAMSKIMGVCTKRGIEPIVDGTYKDACEAGWAPMPTNDVQRSIWQKVHEMPAEPLKILPEKTKVEK